MIKSINELTPPNLATLALVADVQAYEPYGSAALNRQMRGVLSKGVYSGFNVVPSTGLKVNVTSAGVDAAAAVEVGNDWLITVRQQSDVMLTVPAGRVSSIVLKAFYDGQTITNQVDVDSTVKAAELLVVNAGSEPANSLILCQVNVPSNASSITTAMISYDKRDRVSLEGFWNKLDSEHIAPKGQWFRTILNKGIKPSLDNVRAAAVDTIGTADSWFQEVWANKYRGGSIDVEGTIRAGGKLAMLQGDFGIGSTSKQLATNADLNNLPLENGKYRGVNLLNTPEGAAASSGWWFIDHECHSADHQAQRAIKFAATGHYGVWYRVKLNGTWQPWDCLYSVNNKPSKSDVGLSNVANERQYSAQNNNIGTGATNYAAGNHNHDTDYSKLGHKHVWTDITNPPEQATRWPTLAEIGAQPAGSYAAASHTHPWSQITGVPVYATRWPTLVEIGAQPAGSYAAASHTHPWSQITGVPVTATRWPTLAEIGALPQNGAGVQSQRDFVNGTLVTTAIDYSQEAGAAFYVSIKGNSYGESFPFEVKFQGYIYNNGVISKKGFSIGQRITGIKALNHQGKLCFWWPRQAYWHGFTVHVADVTMPSGRVDNQVLSIDDVAMPSGATKVIDYDPEIKSVYSEFNKPTFTDVGAAPASHAHPWSQITGAPVYTTRWPTLAEIGAGDTLGWRNQTVTFEVGGDANTYYPVLIYKGHASQSFGMDDIHISRFYAAKAPSTWNTATHKGGLSLSISYSGDQSWGGNDHFVKVSYFSEQYTTMVAGLVLSTSGLIVWLRGGGAEYKLNTQNGLAATATPYIGNFTAADGTVYAPQARNADVVAAQIYARMSFRGFDVYDNNVRVYSPINKPTAADLGVAPTNHTHPTISTNYTNWSGNSEAAVVGGLAWRNYGNNHVIFDASSGKTPAGGSCNNATPQNYWSASYPTLMGFNGDQTYGVRVDSARNADTLNGIETHSGRNNEANKVVRTDASGYLQIGWLNTLSGATATGTLFACFNNTSDMYLRYMNADQTRAAIGAQPAGSYAASSHTHPWSQITGIPVQATRWPNATEVGLGNVPNTPHSYAADVGTVPIRDGAGDITSRLFRSEFGNDNFISGAIAFRTAGGRDTDNYIRFCSNPTAIRDWLGAQVAGSYAASSHTHPWSQITGVPVQATRWPTWNEVSGIPVYATRWPTWDEIGGKPPVVNEWIDVYKSTGSYVQILDLPAALINHLQAGNSAYVRVSLNRSGNINSQRYTSEMYLDGNDGWRNMSGQVFVDMTWPSVSYVNLYNGHVANAAANRNKLVSQYSNIARFSYKLV